MLVRIGVSRSSVSGMVNVASASRSISRVALVDQGDDLPAPRFHLFDIGHDLGVHRVPRGNEHHRHVLVDQRDGAVLHLGRGIPLGVDVGDLLQLERAFQRHREVHPRPRYSAFLVVRRNRSASCSISRSARESGRPGRAAAGRRWMNCAALENAQIPEPGDAQRDQGQRGHLAGERLGARHARPRGRRAGRCRRPPRARWSSRPR